MKRVETNGGITVVIPVYNKENALERCVRSVLTQTVLPAKIIIVEDRSTDRSINVANGIALKERNIEVLRNARNMGAAFSRNRGADAAGTEWLAFLDADDHWHPEFLEKVAAGAARIGAGFASSGRVEVTTRGEHREQHFILPREKPGSVVDLTAGFWKTARTFMPINSSANLIRRELFLEAGGFPETSRYWEDHILWCRLWARSRFAFVNEPLSQYYKAPGTLSAGSFFFPDALKFQRALLGALGRSIRMRRPGTADLALYLARFSALVPGAWVSRRARQYSIRRRRDAA